MSDSLKKSKYNPVESSQIPEEYKELHEELVRLSGKEYRSYWIAKRIHDILLSALFLVLLSPLFLILSILIVLDDPHAGPIYVQTRIGRGGKPFRFYKFRSMVANADQIRASLQDLNEKDGPAFKIKDDPRITKIGKFIRKFSLDELPQFWNVLKGDMAIVGPRPPLPEEVAQYNAYHMERLLITPGITCYWQTMKNRHAVSFDEWVAQDICYIRERSLFLDFKLILRTIKVMCTGQGE